MAASFQKAACRHLQQRLKVAMRWCDSEVIKGNLVVAPKSVVVTGGVASNQYLRESLTNVVIARNEDKKWERKRNLKKEGNIGKDAMDMEICFPPVRLCTDNGVMVAWTGHERLALGMVDDATPPEDGKENFQTRWPLGGDTLKTKKGRVLKDDPKL